MKKLDLVDARTPLREPDAVRENPEDVIARIRATRAGGRALSMTSIVQATRSGRR